MLWLGRLCMTPQILLIFGVKINSQDENLTGQDIKTD